MKRTILPTLLAIILTAIIFTGCNPLFPLDKDQFDIGDTVKIDIGEMVYENENFWMRVDSVKEGRCPIGLMCAWAGRAQVWLTVGNIDTSFQLEFSTHYADSSKTQVIRLEHSLSDALPFGSTYIITLVEVNPYPVYGVIPRAKDRWVSFVLENIFTDRKPNIYLYPEKKTKMSVSLQFPHGGKVIESDPFYPLQWKNIKVKPNGKIDKKYDFLFYEAEIPDLWQYSEGWVIAMNDLTEFFKKNLKDYSFNENEIEDFIEFWIPELIDSPYYEIYPQYTEMVNRVIKLKISPYPDAKLRLHYVIKESNKDFDLPAPEIPYFEREGFTVTEWGVVLK
ncbi:MAG: hypothetical protein U9Q91_04070 [Candidatus Marinimicrobia bacterium]|nr:hypothetical protein [Candidatus Neomarinimicrobiota bacterium]